MSQVLSKILGRKVTTMSNPSAQNLEESTPKKSDPIGNCKTTDYSNINRHLDIFFSGL